MCKDNQTGPNIKHFLFTVNFRIVLHTKQASKLPLILSSVVAQPCKSAFIDVKLHCKVNSMTLNKCCTTMIYGGKRRCGPT